MNRILFVLLLIAMPAIAADLQSLEKTVVQRAERDPATAEEYFIRQIEKRPAPSSEEQAVYVFGMGIAAERQGRLADALDFYIGAAQPLAAQQLAQRPNVCKASAHFQRNEKPQPCSSLAAAEALKAQAAKHLILTSPLHNFIGRSEGSVAAVFASQGDNAIQLSHVLQCQIFLPRAHLDSYRKE